LLREKRRSDERRTEADIPDVGGKDAIVIGANSGLGFEVAALWRATPTSC
jgi:hypothetical protein